MSLNKENPSIPLDRNYGIPLERPSYQYVSEHLQDDLKNTGFAYQDKLLTKTVSNYLLSDTQREYAIGRLQILINQIVDYVSNIRRGFNYTVDKKYKYLN